MLTLAGRRLFSTAVFALLSLALFVVGAAPTAHALQTVDGPTTPIIDDFNRANEIPVSQGGLWANGSIDAGQRLQLGNTQLHALYNGQRGSAYRLVPQTGDMEAHATIALPPQNVNGAVIFINLKDVGTTGFDGYGLRLYKPTGAYVWN